MENLSLSTSSQHLYAIIDYEDGYVQPLILSAMKKLLPLNSYSLISSLSELPSPQSPFLQISSYETLPFTHLMSHPTTSLSNAYIIRKALIRKHYLSTTAHNWTTKHPSSILSTNMKPSCDFELDYAEFLDDALVEAWELHESWTKNEGKKPEEREWWILKPGMSDRGQGIRLFSTEEELLSIFEEWEADLPDSDEEDEDNAAPNDENQEKEEKEGKDDYIITSHLRHFIAQPYIHPPLLLSTPNPRKFHIRTYVLASGSLDIYVYKPMLALFAAAPYIPPWTTLNLSQSTIDLSPHLTNTCLQNSNSNTPSASSVLPFWSLPLPSALKTAIWAQIRETTGEIFEAAVRGMSIHFQPLPNAFEVFGLDFLVDEGGKAWLLECNAFPDFRQTGEELRGVVEGLWEEVVAKAVAGFFEVNVEGGGEKSGGDGEEGGSLVLVRRVELGRR